MFSLRLRGPFGVLGMKGVDRVAERFARAPEGFLLHLAHSSRRPLNVTGS
jgi:hypothetical protein